jgi:hypothetical protein
MSDKDLIDIMVRETLSEKKSLDPFKLVQPFGISAIYDKTRLCFVIEGSEYSLEIPENWGPFKNRLSASFEITPESDKELFLPIISSFLGKELSHIMIELKGVENKFESLKSA